MIPIFKSTVFKGSPVFMVKCLTNPTKHPKTVPMNTPILHNIIIITELNQLTLNPHCWCIYIYTCKPCLNPACFMIKLYYHGDYSYMISHMIPLLSWCLVIFGGWNLHLYSAKFWSDLRHSEPNAQTTGPGGPWDLGNIGIGYRGVVVLNRKTIGETVGTVVPIQHMVASPWNRLINIRRYHGDGGLLKWWYPKLWFFFIAPFHVSPCFTSIWVKNGYSTQGTGIDMACRNFSRQSSCRVFGFCRKISGRRWS